MKQRVLFFDLARCVAAVAVIAIHVLGPYRQLLGEIPFQDWFFAISVNSVSRWAVPVFILISGALMLSDKRPFDLKYYVSRRLGKVLVPFIVWSLFYAYFSGWSASGFDGQHAMDVLEQSATHSTYYHLGFFYYFIPLYFVIPLFRWFVGKFDDGTLYAFTGVWLVTTVMYLLRIDGPWSHQMWLYSGLLPLGYILYQKIPANRTTAMLFALAGLASFAATIYMVTTMSLEADKYSFGRWLSYKTINTIAAASMVFMLCRYFGEGLSDKTNKVVGFISRHSLGIYILHPIFLWPYKEFGWYEANPMWVIPVWIVISGSLSLLTSWLLSKSAKTRWLLP